MSDSRPRLLYATHRVPYPPDKGDRIRNYHVLRQLSRIGDVSLACLADEPVTDETTAELKRLCREVAIIPVSRLSRLVHAGWSWIGGRSLSEGAFRIPAFERAMADWQRRKGFDAAICSASSLAPMLRRNGLDRVPGFVDIVDCDGQKWFDFAEAVKDFLGGVLPQGLRTRNA